MKLCTDAHASCFLFRVTRELHRNGAVLSPDEFDFLQRRAADLSFAPELPRTFSGMERPRQNREGIIEHHRTYTVIRHGSDTYLLVINCARKDDTHKSRSLNNACTPPPWRCGPPPWRDRPLHRVLGRFRDPRSLSF